MQEIIQKIIDKGYVYTNVFDVIEISKQGKMIYVYPDLKKYGCYDVHSLEPEEITYLEHQLLSELFKELKW